jgi:hypothetical protein
MRLFTKKSRTRFPTAPTPTLDLLESGVGSVADTTDAHPSPAQPDVVGPPSPVRSNTGQSRPHDLLSSA